jgi:UDP-GlcNAc3NAcA epimerase
MKRIVSVVGARPQFVKAAVVSRALAKAGGIQEKLVHTGQHYDDNMSEVFFRELGIAAPDHHLGVHGGSHGEMTGRMLAGIERVLLDEKPGLVLIYGDTNSTLAAALAAVKLHIPVAHVEAGLRSFNARMPEEINRIVADRVSRWLLCPTAVAQKNLLAEGIAPERIHVVGDVMYDAVLHYAARAVAPAVSGAYCVATVHRAENTDDPALLGGILRALEEVSRSIPVVLPLHPRTRARVAQFGLSAGGVRIVEPVGYLEMLGLLRGCEAVFTDSGGLQKEAYFLGKPCVTLRTETEWVELVDLGVNVVTGADAGAIIAAWKTLRSRQLDWSARPYGDGDAGGRVAAVILRGVE